MATNKLGRPSKEVILRIKGKLVTTTRVAWKTFVIACSTTPTEIEKLTEDFFSTQCLDYDQGETINVDDLTHSDFVTLLQGLLK